MVVRGSGRQQHSVVFVFMDNSTIHSDSSICINMISVGYVSIKPNAWCERQDLMKFGLQSLEKRIYIHCSTCVDSNKWNRLQITQNLKPDILHDFVSIFKVNLLFLHIFIVKEVLGIIKPVFTVHTVVAFTTIIITLQQRSKPSSLLNTLNGWSLWFDKYIANLWQCIHMKSIMKLPGSIWIWEGNYSE